MRKKQISYPTESRHTSTTLKARDKDEIVDDQEGGVLLGYFLQANSPNVTMDVQLYGDDNSQIAHDESIKSLLEHGLGLSPGDIVALPDGKSPDPHGTPNPFTPYVTRYKDGTDADGLGNTERTYAVAYTPASPPSYKRVRIRVLNLSGEDVVINHMHLFRMKVIEPDDPRSTGAVVR